MPFFLKSHKKDTLPSKNNTNAITNPHAYLITKYLSERSSKIIKAIGAIVQHEKRAVFSVSWNWWRKKRYNASLTVEAAVILPVFLSAFLILASLFQAMSVYEQMDVSLCAAGRELALYSMSEKEISIAKLYAVFHLEAKKHGLSDKNIEGNAAGIVLSLKESDVEKGIWTINARYSYYVPGLMIGSYHIWMKNQIFIRTWVGETRNDKDSAKEKTEGQQMYVAEHGVVYHTDSECTHLKLSIRAVSAQQLPFLRNRSGSIYQPCEKCSHLGQTDHVFITDYGNAWHTSRECSGLKRTYQTMTENEAKTAGLRPCQKCGGRQ